VSVDHGEVALNELGSGAGSDVSPEPRRKRASILHRHHRETRERNAAAAAAWRSCGYAGRMCARDSGRAAHEATPRASSPAQRLG
jgi:hypothetical protein